MQPQLSPGAEFFQRRLQRAQAVPAEERSPDVAAFVESAELQLAVPQLLPLTVGGLPALPPTAATRQRVLRAELNDMKAVYICPIDPICGVELEPHWRVYVHLLCPAAGADELTEVVWACIAPPVPSNFSKMQRVLAAADRLADPSIQQAVSRQLAQLAADTGQPAPLTAQQLRYGCYLAVAPLVLMESTADRSAQPSPGGGQQRRRALAEQAIMRSALTRAAQAMQELEPANFHSYATAAKAIEIMERGDGDAEACLYLRAYQLARQQGSDWWMVYAGCMALYRAMNAIVSRGALQAAMAASQQAAPALRRCKRLLPHAWVQSLEILVATAGRLLPAAQARLQGQLASSRTRVAEEAISHAQAGLASATTGQLFDCHGCGKDAAGLRRCARCKQAQYCSRECQAAHWREHKPACKPAQ